MYIDMYQIENYQIEIPDNTAVDEVSRNRPSC